MFQQNCQKHFHLNIFFFNNVKKKKKSTATVYCRFHGNHSSSSLSSASSDSSLGVRMRQQSKIALRMSCFSSKKDRRNTLFFSCIIVFTTITTMSFTGLPSFLHFGSIRWSCRVLYRIRNFWHVLIVPAIKTIRVTKDLSLVLLV